GEGLDCLLFLAAVVLAPGVDGVEEGLALVALEGGLEGLLHLVVLLLTEEDGGEHRLRLPEAEQGAAALAQVGLGLVEFLLHVEQDADVGVQAGGDAELPAGEREGVLQPLDRPPPPAGHHLLLGDGHDRLELLAAAAGEQDVGADRAGKAEEAAEPWMDDARRESEEEDHDAGCETEKKVDHDIS